MLEICIVCGTQQDNKFTKPYDDNLIWEADGPNGMDAFPSSISIIRIAITLFRLCKQWALCTRNAG